MATIIKLELTCEACPEQYWAKIDSKIIGYIRLRFGHLTCDYLPTGELTNNDIRVLDYTFADSYKGSFSSKKERIFWLSKCKEALINTYNELKGK